MNLVEIRKLFRDSSGRFDLVHDDLSNATEVGGGADVFINEAVQWLDRRTNINRAWGTHAQWVPQGTWVVQFPMARALRQIQVNRQGVCIVPALDMMAYLNQVKGNLSQGLPTMCAVLATGNLALGDDDPIPPHLYKEFFKTLQIISDAPEELNTVMFNATAPSEGLMVSFSGMFYQLPLIEDEDVNYWSRHHSMLLVNAAIRQVYVTSGNKALLDIINGEIDKDLAAISMDRIEEDFFGSVQMRSNF